LPRKHLPVDFSTPPQTQSESEEQESIEASVAGAAGVPGAGLGEGTQPITKAKNSKMTIRLFFMMAHLQ
jgi:hypothetical protein